MKDVQIRNFTPDDAPRMTALQERCLQVCPDIGKAFPAGFYYAPGFESGKNIFCAIDENGDLLGYMHRDLSEPLPDVSMREGVEIRQWRMETEAEQIAYVKACNEAFQNDDRNLAELQHFIKSRMWSVGTTFAAFAGQELVGNVLVVYDPASEKGEKIGFTDYVFVLAPWRRRGIATYLLKEGLVYLKERDLAKAELEVVSDNRHALGLYESVGYRVVKESVSLGLALT